MAVVETSVPRMSAVMADAYCGEGTKLVYYMKPGTLLSRSFTSKDTHSPRGDLLVVYSDGRGADHDTLASAEATSALLGFESPVFTFGTDLILPISANKDLRELIAVDADVREDDEDAVLKAMTRLGDFKAPEVGCKSGFDAQPEFFKV